MGKGSSDKPQKVSESTKIYNNDNIKRFGCPIWPELNLTINLEY